jgi:hypothetical protein
MGHGLLGRPVKYKTEVLGSTLRIVEDTGSEFENDVLVLGDCRDPDVQQKAEKILRELNPPRGKPCTCDNCLGSSCACRIEAGERLGELWYCRKQHENPISFQQAVAEYQAAKKAQKSR